MGPSQGVKESFCTVLLQLSNWNIDPADHFGAKNQFISLSA
jgi:hypothetical protein